MSFSIETTDCANAVVLKLGGRLVAAETGRLREIVWDTLSLNPKMIILDLTQLSFCDSSGLAELVAALRQARQHNVRFALTGLNDSLLALMRLTRLDKVFEIYPDCEEAVAAAAQ